MKINEYLFLIVLFAVTFFINLHLFGIDRLFSNTDFSFHDTYFVVPNFEISALISSLLFFIAYLIKVLLNKFSKTISNFIMLISLIALIGIISIFHSNFKLFSFFYKLEGTVINDRKNDFDFVFKLFYIFEMALVVLLAYLGIRTGINFNKKS